jgi:hypothetical protein
MKVGDIVRQTDKVLKMSKGGKKTPSPKALGVVVEIRNQLPPKKEETERLMKMMALLGRQVDVLWSSGRLSKNFAENSLEVIK